MHVKIEIETKTFVRFVAVLAAFALATVMIIKLRTPLTFLVVSTFLALALNPPVSRLARLLPRNSRIGATALSYLVVVGVLGAFLVLVVPPAVQQSVSFVQQVPGFIDGLQEKQGPARDFLRQYGLEEQFDTSIENAKSQATSLAQNIGTAFVSGAGAVLNGFIALLTVLVLTFLLLIEGPTWLRRIWSLYTDDAKQERHEALLKRMYHVVTGYVNGQVLVAGISATASLIVLLILGTFLDVSYSLAIPLAGVVFLGSMIPMVGATIGAAIVTAVLLFSSLPAAMIFLAYFIIYQQIENNIIQPIVQARTVELTALSVITAVLMGVYLFGIIGALVAIPVAGCIRVLTIHYVEERQHKAATKPDNIFHKIKKSITTKKTKNA